MPTSPASPTGSGAPQAPGRARTWWLVCVLGVVMGQGLFLWQPALLRWFGIAPYPQFIDSMALLAAGEAAQQGFDVYRPNPLDPFARPHSYPSLWLVLGHIGLVRADNEWFAWLTIGCALLAGVLTVRPRTVGETAAAWLGLCGPAMLIAIYRANNDLWIFAICALLVPAILTRVRLGRLAAPVLIAFAGALKYYPLVAGVLLLAEPVRRDRWLRIGLFGMLLLIVTAGVLEDLRHFGKTQPTVGRFSSFGAPLTLREAGLDRGTVTAVSLVLGAGVVAAGALARGRGSAPPADAWQQREFLFFLLGGSLLVGCFWTSANWAYRWIFVVWLLPWFWRGPKVAGALWRIVRGGWWLPMWFVVLVRWLLLATDIRWPVLESVVWWLSQAIDWLWFGALTAVLARCVVARVRGTDGEMGLPTEPQAN